MNVRDGPASVFVADEMALSLKVASGERKHSSMQNVNLKRRVFIDFAPLPKRVFATGVDHDGRGPNRACQGGIEPAPGYP